MATYIVDIPDELDARLVAFAEAKGISVNTAIVQAVKDWVRMCEHRARVRAVTANRGETGGAGAPPVS